MEAEDVKLPPVSPVPVLAEPEETDLEAPPAPPAPRHPHEADLPVPALPQPSNQNHPPRPPRPPRPHQLRPEWLNLVMGFGYLAIGIRSQCPNSGGQSFSFHMVCLCIVLASAAFTVSNYIPANLEPLAQLLEHAGVFCGFTAFFLAMTPTLPLFLLIISWAIYAVSVVVIMLSLLGFF